MYQSQPIDLAQIFLAAQQMKAQQQDQRLRQQQQQMLAQKMQQENDQREAMALLPEAVQALQYSQDGAYQKPFASSAKAGKVATQTPMTAPGDRATMPGSEEAFQAINRVIPEEAQKYQANSLAQRASAEHQRQVFELRSRAAQGDSSAYQNLARVAPDDPWLKNRTEQMRKDFSPELVQASNAFGLDPETGLGDQRVLDAMQSQAAGKNPDMRTNNLRQEFQGLQPVKDSQTIATAYNKIMSTSETGAGDMSLIFGYMKLLDPNSTVREGEYATAQNAGSLPQNVIAFYNRTLSGEKLAPELRAQFKNEAGKVYGAQMQRYDAIANQYKRIAQQSGINPSDVVLDTFTRPKPAEPAPPPPGIEKVSDEELRRAAGIQ
jgi:hypothetical protein